MIPISTVRFGAEEEDAVIGVLRSGRIAQGSFVEKFERGFAELCGVRHAIAVNNGTTALVTAIEVLDLEPGDEIVTSPFTFAATLNAILESGATAVFADIREDDYNVDPASMADRIGSRTRALLPVHLYGQTADMDAITEIAHSRGLALVEDSAQSHGASDRGRMAGSFGIGTFSFYATKNITTGEGGMVTTDDDSVADRLRVLRNQGMRARYDYEEPGHNYRLTDLQAALALPQLARYPETVAARQRNAACLIEGLRGLPGISLPRQLDGRVHVWHQFTIRLTEECPVSRDEFVERLRASGVDCGIYYPKLLFDYDAYKNHPRVIRSDAPVAARIARQVVSLPVHQYLSEADLANIVSAVGRAMGSPRG